MYNEGIKTYVAAEDLEQYRRVKINSSGTAEYADDDTPGDGVTLCRAESGEQVTVRHFNDAGTFEIESSGVLTCAAEAYAADDGKVQPLPGTAGTYYKIGKALEAAEDGSIPEILPHLHGFTTIVT
jgi:hypothetical protein